MAFRNIYEAVDAVKLALGLPNGGVPIATVAYALVDTEGNVISGSGDSTPLLASTLASSPSPSTVKVSVPLASLVAVGAATSGSTAVCTLPAKSVVMFTTMKPTEAFGGAAAVATGTLTSDATAPSDGDTVTIGNKTYTFKTTLTPTEGQVLIGVSAAVALDNIKAAVNHTGTPDTDYKCAAAHTQVTATTNTNTTQVFQSIATGAAANLIVTTEVGTHTSFGAATLTGGATISAATARITTANTNYGTAYDVFQPVGDTILDIMTTAPKSENFASTTPVLLTVTATGANFSTFTTGAVDCYITYFVRP